ncbi:MAG: hypothetical protein QM715_04400 [Nibricoccus sp.]
MHRNVHSLLTKELFKQALASVAVALVLLLTFLSASPQAHEWLHVDAGQTEHECAITLFSHATEAPLVAVLLAVVIWRRESFVCKASVVFVSLPDFRLLPGRAPPVR